ncbi:hypothetical protein BDW75DRAFT_94236 [Aspergillus navahoensis]
MHLSKTFIPLALLAPLAAAILDDANALTDILTADDSTPESAYSVNPTVAETALGAPVGVSGSVATSSPAADGTCSESSSTSTDSGSVTTGSGEPETTADAATTATTTSIPTNILTAIESDPTGSAAGSLTTVIATATTQQSGSGAAETSSSAATATPSDDSEGNAASPTPTDDGAAAVLGSPASMLGAVLLSIVIRLF